MNGSVVQLIGSMFGYQIKNKNGVFSHLFFMRFRYLFISFLLLVFLVSMEFLVFNAETLVALCFLLFVYLLVKYFGDSIRESLKERSVVLEREFEECFRIERESLELVSSSYARQLNLSFLVKEFFRLLNRIHAVYVDDVSFELSKYYALCIEQVLFQLRSVEESFSRDIHKYYIQRLFVSVENVPSVLHLFQESFPMNKYSKTFLGHL